MSIHEKYAKLREAYPDEVDKINAEDERMMELLKTQEYYELPTTKRLIAMCRKHIVDARMKLSTNRMLTNGQRNDLWLLVDSREWFIRMVAKNYNAEIEQIDRELEAELSG
jgi:hypothetical protein